MSTDREHLPNGFVDRIMLDIQPNERNQRLWLAE